MGFTQKFQNCPLDFFLSLLYFFFILTSFFIFYSLIWYSFSLLEVSNIQILIYLLLHLYYNKCLSLVEYPTSIFDIISIVLHQRFWRFFLSASSLDYVMPESLLDLVHHWKKEIRGERDSMLFRALLGVVWEIWKERN